MSKKGPRILIVEDDKYNLKAVQTELTREGYEIFTAESGEEALEKIIQYQFDLIVLDIVLTGMDGLEVCKWIREQIPDRVPIIILTVKDNDTDMLHAFSVYANDYVTKPYSMPVFLARVKAHLYNLQPKGPVFSEGPLTIDFSVQRVLLNGQEVRLTRIEYRLLEILIYNRGKLVSPDTLIRKLWGENEFGREREIAVYIHNLRKKIDPQHQLIETRYHMGYRFKADL